MKFYRSFILACCFFLSASLPLAAQRGSICVYPVEGIFGRVSVGVEQKVGPKFSAQLIFQPWFQTVKDPTWLGNFFGPHTYAYRIGGMRFYLQGRCFPKASPFFIQAGGYGGLHKAEGAMTDPVQAVASIRFLSYGGQAAAGWQAVYPSGFLVDMLAGFNVGVSTKRRLNFVEVTGTSIQVSTVELPFSMHGFQPVVKVGVGWGF